MDPHTRSGDRQTAARRQAERDLAHGARLRAVADNRVHLAEIKRDILADATRRGVRHLVEWREISGLGLWPILPPKFESPVDLDHRR